LLAIQHWQNVMSDPMGTAKGVNQAEVNKMDYIDDGATAGGPVGSTTGRAGAYETWLQNKYANRLQVNYVQPWGSVLGFRDGHGDWAFYLQENATIFFVEYKKNFLGMRKNQTVTTGMRYVSRPMTVTQIFPAGVGHAWIPNQQPKLKFA